MYKDMDEQRDRIQKLEEAYRAQLHNQNPEEEIPLPPKQQVLPQKQFVPKQQFVPQNQFVQQNEVNNLKLELPNKMVVKTDFITPNKEKVEHPVYLEKLPVYLEKDEENSLEEGDNLEEDNLEEGDNLEEEGGNLEEEGEESTESDEEESSSTYISKKSVLEIYSNENLEETAKVSCSEELQDVLNNLEIEINNDILPTNKYDSSNLTKLKVSELQEIAKNENISLDKKVNGSNKKKTKQELIDELITK
jgi:hypothetical protein